jgi:hypothetical protein
MGCDSEESSATTVTAEAAAFSDASGDGPLPPTNGSTMTSTDVKMVARKAKRLTGEPPGPVRYLPHFGTYQPR